MQMSHLKIDANAKANANALCEWTFSVAADANALCERTFVPNFRMAHFIQIEQNIKEIYL